MWGGRMCLTTCMICSNLQQESLFMPTASLQSTPTSCHLYYSTSVGMESSSLAPRDQNSRDYLKKRSYLSLSGRAVTFNQVLTSAAVQSCPPLTSLSVSYPTLWVHSPAQRVCLFHPNLETSPHIFLRLHPAPMWACAPSTSSLSCRRSSLPSSPWWKPTQCSGHPLPPFPSTPTHPPSPLFT